MGGNGNKVAGNRNTLKSGLWLVGKWWLINGVKNGVKIVRWYSFE